jgi:glycogen operon protein
MNALEISEGRADPLGGTYDGRGTNFSVFSSVAHNVELCLFDDRDSEQRYTLPGRTGSYWHGYVASIGPGQRYGFRVEGPWNPGQGHLCSSEKLLLDPYGKAVNGAIQWDDSLFPCDPEHPADPARGGDSAPFMPKSVVIDSLFDWKDDRPPRTRLEDTIIYEAHVKGLTIRHPGVPPELRGTYAGLAHRTSIDHLNRMGITAVELLPVHQFIHRRTLVERGLVNYWGYDPICFFAPHSEYARDRSPGGAVREFKAMIRALHSAGLEVILDVVFNHTGEGGLGGPVLSFKGFDNGAYYRLKLDDAPRYVDYTGTQNTLNAEHPQVRQMIIDSLRYWATEMHVDGFRFDLGPVLVREGDVVNLESDFFEAVRLDPELRHVKLIAEPWDLGDNGYQLGRFPAGWSEWNDRYRDGVRDFWSRRDGAVERFALRFAGSPDVYGPAGRTPQASVNFITCHDGFTLHDLVSYRTKHNDPNGERNNDGENDNHSSNSGVEGPTDNENIKALRARQKRNFLATLLLSQGVPMLLGGDELGRTQRGNNNAYCQDNEISWFDWENADGGMLEFVPILTGIRKQHPVFRRREWLFPSVEGSLKPHAMAWYDAGGREIHMGKGTDKTPMPCQVLLAGGGARVSVGEVGSSNDDDVLVVLNPTDGDTDFILPQSPIDRPWFKIVDTSLTVQPSRGDAPQVNGTVLLAAHAIAVLSRLASGNNHSGS